MSDAEPLERRLLKARRAGRLDAITWEGRLEQALEKNLLKPNEAELLKKARTKTLEVIAVDEFEAEELRAGVSQDSDLRPPYAA